MPYIIDPRDRVVQATMMSPVRFGALYNRPKRSSSAGNHDESSKEMFAKLWGEHV